MLSTTWTKPYYGIQHLSPNGCHNTWWATVEDHGSFTVVALWFPGCGFSPNKETYPTIAEAQKRGEDWTYTKGRT